MNKNDSIEIKEDIPVCNILGVNIAAVNMGYVVELLRKRLKDLSGKYICVSNVHTTVMSFDNKEYLNIQNGSFMALPDGRPLSIEMTKRGFKNVGRVTGPDLMAEMFALSEREGYKHFFYGSSQDTLDRLKIILEKKYPKIQIVGMYSPPYRKLTLEEDNAVIEMINKLDADLVWVGLGAPKQEIWMAEHKDRVKGLMIGVGAGFDYHAGKIKRAPIWMQRCSLEWLYRLLQDPKRLFKRYLDTNIKYLSLVRRDRKQEKKNV